MKTELIIDGNAVYEIDMDCNKKRFMENDAVNGHELRRMEVLSGNRNENLILCMLLALLVVTRAE